MDLYCGCLCLRFGGPNNLYMGLPARRVPSLFDYSQRVSRVLFIYGKIGVRGAKNNAKYYNFIVVF